ncbi:hypothetical protein BDQ12DRAFT_738545 [Crucibulum laeve]|uniref:Uncharacterized protein n=1 Tax=Crucibulum laeve TaxID=68775 RepID=A0A5C3LL78_9AGAR|nr:hypothetical protein BDQ12DRAFT_671973 [Crucibulum laeve]TFK33889.1 hypothetical protein BDQ12DRAFT_738545 [Crucibulum laeve]
MPSGLTDKQQPMLLPLQARCSNPFSSSAPSPALSVHAQLDSNDPNAKEQGLLAVVRAADEEEKAAVPRRASIATHRLSDGFPTHPLPRHPQAKPNHCHWRREGGGGRNGKNAASPGSAISGGDDSVELLANDTSFVYSDPFGGLSHDPTTRSPPSPNPTRGPHLRPPPGAGVLAGSTVSTSGACSSSSR